MRMWMVNPKFLCTKHLLGEHGEIHKHRHNFVKKHSITGRIQGNACEPLSMQTRHDELETEIRYRAVQEGRTPPSSPYTLPDLSHLPENEKNFKVDVNSSLELLKQRCLICSQKIEKYFSS